MSWEYDSYNVTDPAALQQMLLLELFIQIVCFVCNFDQVCLLSGFPCKKHNYSLNYQ